MRIGGGKRCNVRICTGDVWVRSSTSSLRYNVSWASSAGWSVAGTPVPLSDIQVGDILYWGGAGSAYHTGVYIGNGQYLDAANPSKGVVIQDLSGYPASGAVRVL